MNRKSIGKKTIVSVLSASAVVVMLNLKALDTEWLVECQASTSSFKPEQSHLCKNSMLDSVNWFDWLGGKSRSYQFHFLDLLELLYSDDNDDSGSGFNSSTTSAL